MDTFNIQADICSSDIIDFFIKLFFSQTVDVLGNWAANIKNNLNRRLSSRRHQNTFSFTQVFTHQNTVC